MAGQLFNFSKYFKKNSDHSDIQQASTPPVNTDSQPTIVSTSSYNAQASVASPTTVTSYSGIGQPKSSVSYSGIGPSPVTQSNPAPIITSTAKTSSTAGNPASSSSAIDMNKRVGMDVLSRLTARSNKVLMQAVDKVKELKSDTVDTEHVLWSLISDSSIYQLISECKAIPQDLKLTLEKSFKTGNSTTQPHFSPRVKRVLELALTAARSLGYEFISPEHMLLALSHEAEGVAAQTLVKFNLTSEVLNKKITGKKEMEKEGEDKKKTSAIEQFTEDLTAKATRGELDPVVGRSWEIERIIHILSRRTKNNPVLIGEAGVGKTAIVEGLAIRISTSDVPETLLHKRVLSLDLMSLIAGARHRGEFEERLKELIKEVKAASGGMILFIDELHNMVGAGSGGEGTMDAGNILKPSLARGELQTIGTTTVTEYRKYIEKDPALARRFQPVLVNEPTAEVATQMLLAIRDKYEAFHRVKITDDSVDAAVKLSQRYIGDRFLPDKAVDLIDEAAASVRLPAISLPEDIKTAEDKLKKLESEIKESEKTGDKLHLDTLKKEKEELDVNLGELRAQYQAKKSSTTNTVTPEIIATIVSRWTNIPISRLTESESTKLINMEDIIHKRLIDQEAAVTAVSEAVRRGRAGLKSNKRPIGSFVFMGPTGVGKTELAKTLAEILFGSEEMMIRIDMTEYMEKHEVAKLIGAPPGYVGYEEGGQLTEAVRRRPYAVVLLDEIEKAHPDVFNILIQLLDDGRLTDNKGHTISFKNTIVICTSNLGSNIIQDEMLKENSKFEIRNSKIEIFNTYTFSPTGRELITWQNFYFEKDPAAAGGWKKQPLESYFAGSITDGDTGFPAGKMDTHVIVSDGSEYLSQADDIWVRTSTTAKNWVKQKLLIYFSGHTVINALPDKPDEQLPTTKLDSNAISPLNQQIISLGDRFWARENLTVKDWVSGKIADYFAGATLEESTPTSLGAGGQLTTDVPLFPTEKWDIHLFKPTGEEIIIAGSFYYLRRDAKVNTWIYGDVKELFPTNNIIGDEKALLPFGNSQVVLPQKDDSQFQSLTEKLMTELRKLFRPELINRFDEVVVFRPLTREHMSQIVLLQIKILSKLLLEQEIGLSVTEAASTYLANVGFDPIFGARPLRRTLQRLIENPISSKLIKGEVIVGSTVAVDLKDNELTFIIDNTSTSLSAGRKQITDNTSTSLSAGRQQTTDNRNQIADPSKPVSGQSAVYPPVSHLSSLSDPSDLLSNNPQPTTHNPPPITANNLADYFTGTDNPPVSQPPVIPDASPASNGTAKSAV